LESADAHPIAVGSFLLLGTSLVATGIYVALSSLRMEVDGSRREVSVRTSFLLFHRTETLGFHEVREVGVKESYLAGSPTEESGTSYAAELRGARDLEVPGSRSPNSDTAVAIAREIADRVSARFDPEFRHQVTGSFKLGT